MACRSARSGEFSHFSRLLRRSNLKTIRFCSIQTFEPKYPKAVLTLQKDRDELMAFYDFPAQHWQSLRTTNPIESTFGTIRHRAKRSKDCLSRDDMLHMMYKLGICAQKNWRRQRGFDYLAKVITGENFKDGIEVTESNQAAA